MSPTGLQNFLYSTMNYHRRSMASSFLDAFSLNPLPFPVLLVLAVVGIFLVIQWFVSYEDVVESTKEGFGWVLLPVPLLLLFAAHWLSSTENLGWMFSVPPWARQRIMYYWPSEGSSPWGVAAFIILLLVLLQYQSTFLGMWF